MQILGALECEEMDTTTVKSHQKRHWSVLLNPSLDVRLGQFKKQLQN